MLPILLLLQSVSLGSDNFRVDAAMTPPTKSPAWSDEFNGPGIDRAKWRFDTSRNAAGWYNNERQYYSADRRANARVAGSKLEIIARRENLSQAGLSDWGGQPYSSAKLVSRPLFGPGFFEVRARLPCGRGGWPAIWLLPATGTWPDQGEIDLMEMVGWQPTVIHATLHTGLFNHRLGTQRGAERTVPTACTAFHRYQLDWRADRMRIGVDGRAYMEVRNDRPGGAGAWPFTRPFQLMLNLAVGGDWGGQRGIDDASFPQRMTVDYVRYWRPPRSTPE